jgi:hypothetical protein
VAVISLAAAGCGGSSPAIESVWTDLRAEACEQKKDLSDPNETPYLACQGAAGYELRVRQVESGRQSLDVVDPAKRVTPLRFEQVVTRSMNSLANRAEWRVQGKTARGFIIRVEAREDAANPENVTSRLWVVAKLGPNEICATDRIEEKPGAEAEARGLADNATERRCLAPLAP